MKCLVCGERMEKTRGEYAYASLPGVTLTNVDVYRCAGCEEEEISIPRIEELNRAIAAGLTQRKASLSPAEIRFLRKLLGWSGADFARHFGVTPETVSRWESGKKTMGPVAERLLRMCVATQAPVENYALEELLSITRESAPPPGMTLRAVRGGGWKAA